MTIDEKMLKEQLVTITEEVITAGNLKKEVNKDFGTTKRNSSNRGSSRKDEQVDWQAEYERVHGRG